MSVNLFDMHELETLWENGHTQKSTMYEPTEIYLLSRNDLQGNGRGGQVLLQGLNCVVWTLCVL